MAYDEKQEALQSLGYLLAEAPRNVVFVVGAGLSSPAGIPRWEGLCDALKRELLSFWRSRPTDAPESIDDKRKSLDEFQNLWLLGDHLREELPSQRYKATVRQCLTPRRDAPAYSLIWDLAPSGIVSFNLDDLAVSTLGESSEQQATAQDPGRYQRFLLLQRRFVFQPHGHVDDPQSWILGARRRNDLLRDQRYRRFVSSLLAGRRLVIVGFQPTDFAFESLLLDDFRGEADASVGHFWISERLSVERRQWARLNNLTPIEYSPEADDHPEVLAILRQLREFSPRTPPAPLAYDGPAIAVDELPPDEDLRRERVSSIRERLNAAMKGLEQRAQSHEALMDGVADLFSQYSASVRMAWHIKEDSEEYALVWGYRIVRALGAGAFSTVWEVRDVVDDSRYALKVMHDRIAATPRMVEAFRRGVKAMRILSARGVAGMVRFHRAFDVPACVVMEYVDGDTLDVALRGRRVTTLADALAIAIRTGEIVWAGHQLEERVLHRDLKPTNVMLRRAAEVNAARQVVVLDFDLSWHEGALGHSVVLGPRSHSYLAPEQSVEDRRYSSRHTAVDVFGFGMLLAFVGAKRDPDINEHRVATFKERLVRSIQEVWRPTLRAAPAYLAGLIELATKDEQAERISLPALLDNLRVLEGALRRGAVPAESDLALFELGAGLPAEVWEWRDRLVGREVVRADARTGAASVEIALRDDGSGIRVLLRYSAEGAQQRRNLGKYLQTKAEQAGARLRRNGAFTDVRVHVDQGSAQVSASLPAGDLPAHDASRLSGVLAEGAAAIAFEQ